MREGRQLKNAACRAVLLGYPHPMLHSILNNMFHMPLPILEKLLRPIIVYLVLVALLRIFGKRELAQLNPFDLVVLLSLSNTVQNAIIGDDNSVSGGVIGAIALLTVNWVVARVLFKYPRLTRALQGHSTVLVKNGKIDMKALQHESLSHEELMEVIHKQGFESLRQVKLCQLDPNGSFYVEPFEPTTADQQHAAVMVRLDALSKEIAALRGQAAG
jgi:uncharacterized membrane protein YcaP (DUF421 family)